MATLTSTTVVAAPTEAQLKASAATALTAAIQGQMAKFCPLIAAPCKGAACAWCRAESLPNYSLQPSSDGQTMTTSLVGFEPSVRCIVADLAAGRQ